MTKTKLPQVTIVLKHLLRKGSITSWEAIEKYRITRISARIFELRNLGHDIKSIPLKSKENKKFVKYILNIK